jgi:hypothetical protein
VTFGSRVRPGEKSLGLDTARQDLHHEVPVRVDGRGARHLRFGVLVADDGMEPN